MMPSAYTPLFYGSNWVVRLGQVWLECGPTDRRDRPTDRLRAGGDPKNDLAVPWEREREMPDYGCVTCAVLLSEFEEASLGLKLEEA